MGAVEGRDDEGWLVGSSVGRWVGDKVGRVVGRTVGVPVGRSVGLHLSLFPEIGTNPTLHVHTYAEPPDGATAQNVVNKSQP